MIEEGAVVIDRSAVGKLQLAGRDRLDFVNRMSTNAVLGLATRQGRATILTTAIGRMVDRVILLVDSEDVFMLTSPGQAAMVRNWLSRYIFFMDQIQITDVSTGFGLLAVYGPQAAEVIRAATGVERVDPPLYSWQWPSPPAPFPQGEGRLGEPKARVIRLEPLSAQEGLGLLTPAETMADWQARLVSQGARVGDDELYEILRIEAGQPAFGHEISEEYIPLEANLWDDVSFRKGCYIGQEIIARMESRGRLAKSLMGVRLGELPAGAGPWPISAAGKEVGTLTSVAVSPRFGPIGLGFLRTGTVTIGGEVTVRAEGSEVMGRVEEVPFR